MTDELKSISESTAGESEIVPQKGQNKIQSLTHKVVDGDLIDMFDIIPDAIEQSQLPFPIIVQIDNRYACLAGGHLVSRGTPVQCIAIEAEDTSRPALALLKVSLWMTGLLLGTLSYMEQARDVRIIFDLHIEDAGIIVNSNGGDRRSEAFKEQDGEHIQQYLARSLDRSVFTIRIYLDHTRHLLMEALSELVRLGASKRFLIAACKLRTKLLSQLPDSLTAEEIAIEVSKNFLEWFSYYDAKTGEINLPKGEGKDSIKKETDSADGQDDASETKKDSAAATPNPITASESETTHQESNPAPKDNQSGVTDKPPAQEDQKSANGGKQKTVSGTGNGNHDTPDPEKEVELKEEENDIATGNPLKPNISLVNTEAESGVDIYQRIGDIGNNLIAISQAKPARELLGKPIGECISSLLKIVRMVSGVQRSSSSVTLARKGVKAA